MNHTLNEQYIFFKSLNGKIKSNFIQLFIERLEKRVDYRVKQMTIKVTPFNKVKAEKIVLLFISLNKINDRNLKRFLNDEDINITEEEFDKTLDNLQNELNRLELNEKILE